MPTINMYEAKTNLSQLVQRAEAGEEILIARNGKPAVRLVPLSATPVRRPGAWSGRVWMAADFDACDSEIEALFGGAAERP